MQVSVRAARPRICIGDDVQTREKEGFSAKMSKVPNPRFPSLRLAAPAKNTMSQIPKIPCLLCRFVAIPGIDTAHPIIAKPNPPKTPFPCRIYL